MKIEGKEIKEIDIWLAASEGGKRSAYKSVIDFLNREGLPYAANMIQDEFLLPSQKSCKDFRSDAVMKKAFEGNKV